MRRNETRAHLTARTLKPASTTGATEHQQIGKTRLYGRTRLPDISGWGLFDIVAVLVR
jgi:hypothetical protein